VKEELPVSSRWVIVAIHTVSVYGEYSSLLFRIPGGFNSGALLILHEAYIQLLAVFGTD
jgi:hypothetical protein